MNKSTLLLLLLFPLLTFGKEYEVKLHVSGLPANSKPALLSIYNGDTYLIDSVPQVKDSVIIFHVPEKTPTGMLRAVLGLSTYARYSNGQPTMVNFLFNGEDVELAMNFEKPDQTMQVVRSKENRIYFDFLRSDIAFLRKLGMLEQVILNYPDKDDFYKMAVDYYKKYQIQREKFIDKTYNQNKNSLAGKIIKTKKLPFTEGNMAPATRDSIFKSGFLTTFEFNDTTLLYTDIYTDKVMQFIEMFVDRKASPRENENNIIRALDILVPRLDINPNIQQHLLQFLITGFEVSKLENVLAHISSNYLQQCGGSKAVIERRLAGYQKMAVGKTVPDFTVMDIQNNPVNLYNLLSPYRLIIFWHTDCSHCQVLLDELPELAKQEFFKKHQVQLIGISIDDNRESWEKFSADHPLDWINTHIDGGFDNEISAAYNLFATPSMFLIDADNTIIAKPTTIGELKKNISEL